MAGHLHKSFSDQQVRALLERYVRQEIKLEHILGVLKIGRSRFFEILKDYRADPRGFTVAYQRMSCPRKLAPEIEKNILRELRFEKRLIENPDVPLRSYNYSYVRDRLRAVYWQKVSVPTIIKRAKEHDFYLSKPQRKAHDREVLTNYVGELVQHDSSRHKWAPDAGVKWHLITSLDDHSRLLLYAGNGKLNSQGHGKQNSHGRGKQKSHALGKWNPYSLGTPVRLGKTLQERE